MNKWFVDQWEWDGSCTEWITWAIIPPPLNVFYLAFISAWSLFVCAEQGYNLILSQYLNTFARALWDNDTWHRYFQHTILRPLQFYNKTRQGLCGCWHVAAGFWREDEPRKSSLTAYQTPRHHTLDIIPLRIFAALEAFYRRLRGKPQISTMLRYLLEAILSGLCACTYLIFEHSALPENVILQWTLCNTFLCSCTYFILFFSHFVVVNLCFSTYT